MLGPVVSLLQSLENPSVPPVTEMIQSSRRVGQRAAVDPSHCDART